MHRPPDLRLWRDRQANWLDDSAQRACESGQGDSMRRARGGSELIGFVRQNDDGSFKAILAEVAVKGESVIEPVMIDQSEAGAIDETKVFVIVSDENRLGCLFILFGGSKRLDPGPIETFHKLNGGRVADLKADQRVSFAKDKIRCYQLSF